MCGASSAVPHASVCGSPPGRMHDATMLARDALGDLLGDVLLDARQQHGELVAAPAVAGVVVADRGAHRGRGGPQQLVAVQVAVGVVDHP